MSPVASCSVAYMCRVGGGDGVRLPNIHFCATRAIVTPLAEVCTVKNVRLPVNELDIKWTLSITIASAYKPKIKP